MLTDAQTREFERTGYLVIPGLYDAAEMKTISAWTEAVAAWPETPGKWMKYFEDNRNRPGDRILCRMEDFEPYHEGFSTLFLHGKMHAAVSDLFGEPAVLFKDKINFKLPGGDGFKAHQDVQAGWDTYSPLHITALVTIDPCTEDNGCLEMAIHEHRRQLIGEKWKPLDEDALPYRALPTRPGDAVFFDSFIPHRSGPNRTGEPRRVLYVTYNARSAGDHRRDYYNDKRRSYPPDCEREPGKQYVFRV
jgi:ectoine hydroxylase-related dioxygenase (phytanoyl-CoA dioxygenase family)